MNYQGDAKQDVFVVNVLNKKKNGFFLEIGSAQPKDNNNTYVLEKDFDFKGIMIECDPKYLPMYKEIRQNSVHVIDYAENIDYEKLFSVNNVPLHIDYLQIDLEVVNMSTLNTLIKLDQQILSTYKFATVTFETDIYRGDYYNTRQISRDIFLNRGYIMVFSDVDDFEDWYVHPELVDMSYINRLIENNKKKYKQSSRTKGIESIHPNDIEF